MKDKICVYGYKGSKEELAQLLAAGLHITGMKQNGSSWVIEFDPEPKVGRPQKIDKNQILKLRADGLAYAAIARELGCSKAYVIKVCKAEAAPEAEADRILAAAAEQLTDTWAAEYDAVLQSLPEVTVAPQPEPAADGDEIPGQMKVEDFLAPAAPQKKSLKELRKVAGLSQKALAEATGIKLQRIKEYENGKNGLALAGPVTRYTLAKALGCSVNDFEDYYYDK